MGLYAYGSVVSWTRDGDDGWPDRIVVRPETRGDRQRLAQTSDRVDCGVNDRIRCSSPGLRRSPARRTRRWIGSIWPDRYAGSATGRRPLRWTNCVTCSRPSITLEGRIWQARNNGCRGLGVRRPCLDSASRRDIDIALDHDKLLNHTLGSGGVGPRTERRRIRLAHGREKRRRSKSIC